MRVLLAEDDAELAASIVRALAWAASKQPSVINISLVGPANRTLAAAIDNGLRAGETSVAAQTPDLVAACGRLEHEIGEWLGALAQTEDTSR